MNALRLRSLPLALRLALTGVVGSLLLGLWASLRHLEHHHANRDGEAGVSLADLRGAYHGLAREAALARSLERGHPEDLPAEERALLLAWLRGGKVTEQYDDLDLGDSAPAEVIGRRCLACHARKGGQEIAQSVPLDYWDDVEQLAFSRRMEAVPEEILIVSTHTHATSLALVTLAVIALSFSTRFPGALKGLIALLGGVGLAVDLAGWWLARADGSLVVLVVAGGACWSAHVVLGSLVALLEMWLPARRAGTT